MKNEKTHKTEKGGGGHLCVAPSAPVVFSCLLYKVMHIHFWIYNKLVQAHSLLAYS